MYGHVIKQTKHLDEIKSNHIIHIFSEESVKFLQATDEVTPRSNDRAAAGFYQGIQQCGMQQGI